jgi:hypothetical protein
MRLSSAVLCLFVFLSFHSAPSLSQDLEVANEAAESAVTYSWESKKGRIWQGKFSFTHGPVDNLSVAISLWDQIVGPQAQHASYLSEDYELWGYLTNPYRTRIVRIVDSNTFGGTFEVTFGIYQDCYYLKGLAQQLCLKNF